MDRVRSAYFSVIAISGPRESCCLRTNFGGSSTEAVGTADTTATRTKTTRVGRRKTLEMTIYSEDT